MVTKPVNMNGNDNERYILAKNHMVTKPTSTY